MTLTRFAFKLLLLAILAAACAPAPPPAAKTPTSTGAPLDTSEPSTLEEIQTQVPTETPVPVLTATHSPTAEPTNTATTVPPTETPTPEPTATETPAPAVDLQVDDGGGIFYIDENGVVHEAPDIGLGLNREKIVLGLDRKELSGGYYGKATESEAISAITEARAGFFADREALWGEAFVVYTNESGEIVGIWWPDKYGVVGPEGNIASTGGVLSLSTWVLENMTDQNGVSLAKPSVSKIVSPSDFTQADATDSREESRFLIHDANYNRKGVLIPRLVMRLPINTPIVLSGEHSPGASMHYMVDSNKVKLAGMDGFGHVTYVDFGRGDTYTSPDSSIGFTFGLFVATSSEIAYREGDIKMGDTVLAAQTQITTDSNLYIGFFNDYLPGLGMNSFNFFPGFTKSFKDANGNRPFIYPTSSDLLKIDDSIVSMLTG